MKLHSFHIPILHEILIQRVKMHAYNLVGVLLGRAIATCKRPADVSFGICTFMTYMHNEIVN